MFSSHRDKVSVPDVTFGYAMYMMVQNQTLRAHFYLAKMNQTVLMS